MTTAEIEKRRAHFDCVWGRLIGYWETSKSDTAPYWKRQLERERRIWNEACTKIAKGEWTEWVIA